MIYCDSYNQRCSELFKKPRQNKKTGQYDQVPLNERNDNLNTILRGCSADCDNTIIPIVPVSEFMDRVINFRCVCSPKLLFAVGIAYLSPRSDTDDDNEICILEASFSKRVYGRCLCRHYQSLDSKILLSFNNSTTG